MLPPDHPEHIYYRYVINVGKDAQSWIQHLKRRGIESSLPIFRPLHLYANAGGLEKTMAAWEQTLSIPIYPSLSGENADKVIDAVNKTRKEIMRG